MERLFLFAFFLVMWNVLSIEVFALACGWHRKLFEDVQIVSGEYVGRNGRVVSTPCMANGYNTRMQINAAATNGGREWFTVWTWQVKAMAEKCD